jgi:hypothetical protein
MLDAAIPEMVKSQPGNRGWLNNRCPDCRPPAAAAAPAGGRQPVLAAVPLIYHGNSVASPMITKLVSRGPAWQAVERQHIQAPGS